MNWDRIKDKLTVLADAAKYDVSCASSGSGRPGKYGELGSAAKMGICHSFTEDGRCISLLKVLYTNHCIYDCLYCISRKSNETERAAFTVDEVVDLTINFYRRNYIEGLFLSSGIFKSPDFTIERLVRIVKKLRLEHRFNGYIHLKAIPGASDDLIREAGLYADRLSVNLELPTKQGLATLAPDKSHQKMLIPMNTIKEGITANRDEKKLIKYTPKFVPAGQSSQLIVGATNESDLDIVKTSTYLYKRFNLKRVYYSGYVPVMEDSRLPALQTPVPQIRENRLYQTDWLYRFYEFETHEIVNEAFPNLDMEIDPKLAWALRNLDHFPVNINTADYHSILRIPGIGVLSVKKIIRARKHAHLTFEKLKKLGIALNRARHFIICKNYAPAKDNDAVHLRGEILSSVTSKYKHQLSNQLSLF